jgi:hypothetical protein
MIRVRRHSDGKSGKVRLGILGVALPSIPQVLGLPPPTRAEIAALVPVMWDFTAPPDVDINGRYIVQNLGTNGATHNLIATDPAPSNQARYNPSVGAHGWGGYDLAENKSVLGMHVYASWSFFANGYANLNMSENGKNIDYFDPFAGYIYANRSGAGSVWTNTDVLKGDRGNVTRVTRKPADLEVRVNGQPFGSKVLSFAPVDATYRYIFGRAGDGRIVPTFYYSQIWLPSDASPELVDKVEHYLAALSGSFIAKTDTYKRRIIFAGQSLAEHMTNLYNGISAYNAGLQLSRKTGEQITAVDAAQGSTSLVSYSENAPSWWDITQNAPGQIYNNLIGPLIGTSGGPMDVVWSQGEHDCENVLTNRADYKPALIALLTRLHEDLGGKVVINLLGRNTGQYPNPQAAQIVRESQYEAAQELDFVTLGAAQYNQPLQDPVHLTKDGYIAAAGQSGWGLLKAHGLSDVTPPMIVNAQRVGDTIEVNLSKGNSATSWVVNGANVTSADLTPAGGKTSQIELIKADNSRVTATAVNLAGDKVTLTYGAGVLDGAAGAQIYNAFSTGHLLEITKMIGSNSKYLLPIYNVMPVSVSGL